ncbi:MAG: cellulase family glycosylhydrolase [Lachnospiraceae bacterium]|nr:cellulase family glycosylhydrolase [Lachnospiraceae bacterium]
MRKRVVLLTVLLAGVLLSGCGQTAAQTPVQTAETEVEELDNKLNNELETETDLKSTVQDNTTESEETETVTQAQEPVVEQKDDGVRWQDFVADMGMGWNLGNTFDAIDCSGLSDELDYEGAWLPGSTRTTREMIGLVKEQGFRTVRIPVSWHNHVDITADEDGKTVYTISDAWMGRVREVVDYCYDEGLYVVINIHHDDNKDKRFIYPTAECQEQSINYITQIWTQVAEEFAAYDLHLIFEVVNEVRLSGTDDEWTPDTLNSQEAQRIINTYSQAGVDAIRAVDSGYNASRFIMCTGYAGNLYSYKNQVLPTDKGGYPNRIMVSTHPYSPYFFCMDVSENGRSVFDEQVQSDVREVFRVIDQQWTSKDVPVVISEWGTILKADNEESRREHASYYVNQAVTACKDSAGETVQIPCILWDNGSIADVTKGETFGYLDRQNVTWFDQGYVDAVIDACSGDS